MKVSGSANPSYSFVNKLNSKGELETNGLLIAINKLSHWPSMELKNCDLIFAKFLMEVSKLCNESMYGMIALIFRAFREMLNLYGYILLTKLEQ